MIHDLGAYIPRDRLQALARGEQLPELLHGTILFADVSGFTPLTEALSRALGPHRGAEAISLQINRIYDVLIAAVHRWRGSVVSFSGDAITCWFDQRDGAPVPRAAACALAMQQGMAAFAAVPLPGGGTAAITLKVAISSGPARRFVVGDPALQQIDVLTGDAVARVAVIEHETRPGEVLLDQTSALALGRTASIPSWRPDPGSDQSFALLGELHQQPDAAPWPEPDSGALSPELLRPWVLPPVYERSQAGLGAFLTELRPLVAMFVRFTGIDYDRPEAGVRLNSFISDAQHALARYDGVLLQITFGDKGSYLYAGFGAPVAHEDGPRRAVLGALALQQTAAAYPGLALQIGISQGMLLVGVYGSAARTYAATGDEVNVAARLMSKAEPGEILISGAIQKAVAAEFMLETRPPIRLKGKADPLVLAAVRAQRTQRPIRLEEPNYALPLIGRNTELGLLRRAIEQVLAGHPQIIGISAEAGLGKSRLIAEGIRLARRRGLIGYGGACLATATTTPYFVWQTIWRAFFDLDPDAPPRRQQRMLSEVLDELAPTRRDALPLLGPLLGLAIDDTDLTRSLSPKDRQVLLHTLLSECLHAAAHEAAAEGGGLLLVLEDLHWIDAASLDLLRDLAQTIHDHPVLILLAFRPLDRDHTLAGQLAALPHTTTIRLDGLDAGGCAQLIRTKLVQLFPAREQSIPNELVARLTERAQGNPFYLEELLNYLHDRLINLWDAKGLEALELPDTLYSLVLSRLDQLSARQQALLKTASVIGRRFPVGWLHGAFANTVLSSELQDDLAMLLRADLTTLDTSEPELAYLFKHVVTQEVAYTSLSPNTRALLHEQLATYLEQEAGDSPETYLDLLAYHYDHSPNLPKRREYLRRAGLAAAQRFANEAAISYLSRALELAPPEAINERFDLLMAAEQVYDVLGNRPAQEAVLDSLVALADQLQDNQRRMHVALQRLNYVFATAHHQNVSETLQAIADLALLNGAKTIAASAYVHMAGPLIDQGNFAGARQNVEEGLRLAAESNAPSSEALGLFMLSLIEQAQGDFAAAHAALIRALELYRLLGDIREEASTLRDIAKIRLLQGDVTGACADALRSSAMCRAIGDREGEGWALASAAVFSAQRRQFDQALSAISQSNVLLAPGNKRRSYIYWCFSRATINDLIGNYDQAQADLEEALAGVRAFRARRSEVPMRATLAMIRYHQDDYQGAIACARQSLDLARELGNRVDRPLALLAQGHSQVALGQLPAAADAYRDALETQRILGQSHLLVEPLAGLARVALAAGDPAKAYTNIKEILPALDHSPLDGTYEPILVYQTCYQVLAALDDPRAADVLRRGYDLLQQFAATLPEPAARQRFLTAVAAHQQIVTLWSTIIMLEV
ncbi:MAG: adenylate/guanylate cyclase domain-containing protein [Roseiflexaceae bacterium]